MAFEFTVDIAVALPVASLTPSSQQPQTVFCKRQSKIITFIVSFSPSIIYKIQQIGQLFKHLINKKVTI